MKRIYFAGSVNENDWRDSLTKENYHMMDGSYSQYSAKDGGRFTYGGPLAIYNKHYGFAEGNHGFVPGYVGHCSEDAKTTILNSCKQQINQCDAMFAHVNKTDCYGTYFEIGYASAINIPIFLYCSIHCNDLWFIKEATTLIHSLKIPQSLLVYNTKETYYDYLKSDKWKNIARKKRQEAGNRCQLCNNGNLVLHVHHRTYDNVYNEQMGDLIVLCADCHGKFHA